MKLITLGSEGVKESGSLMSDKLRGYLDHCPVHIHLLYGVDNVQSQAGDVSRMADRSGGKAADRHVFISNCFNLRKIHRSNESIFFRL